MNLWTFLFLTVLVVFGTQCFQSWLRHRDRDRKARARGDEEELQSLRARVEVLESIVTERGYHLRDEIGRLEEEEPPRQATG